MSKPLLIGQAPGPRTDPDMPLYPLPATCAGGRLQKMMGLTTREYLNLFDRTNLLHTFPGQCKRDDKFPLREARIAAQAMAPLLRNRVVIFVGRNVANAFGHPREDLPFLEWSHTTKHQFEFSVIPHPSGRNHWYNKEGNRDLVLEFWVNFMEKQSVSVRTDNVVAFSSKDK